MHVDLPTEIPLNFTLTEEYLMDRNQHLLMFNIGVSVCGVLGTFLLLALIDDTAYYCGLGARFDQLSRVMRANNAEAERTAHVFKLRQWKGSIGGAQTYLTNISLCIFCLLELLVYVVYNIGISQETWLGLLASKVVVVILLIPAAVNIFYRLLSTRGRRAATLEFSKTENWLSALTIFSTVVSTIHVALLSQDFHGRLDLIETSSENGISALKIHSLLFLRLLLVYIMFNKLSETGLLRSMMTEVQTAMFFAVIQLLVLIFFFASIMLIAETLGDWPVTYLQVARGRGPPNPQVSTFFQSAYLITITISTVGYGDIRATTVGK